MIQHLLTNPKLYKARNLPLDSLIQVGGYLFKVTNIYLGVVDHLVIITANIENSDFVVSLTIDQNVDVTVYEP